MNMHEDSGYINLEEGDIVFLAAETDDWEFEYVQRLHSDAVGWVRLALLQPVVFSPALPSFHLTFALHTDNLMVQFISRSFVPMENISWSGISFAGWTEQRRPHISVNAIGTPGWDVAHLELLTSDLGILYQTKTGRSLSWTGEIYQRKYWYTSSEDITIITSLDVREIVDTQSSTDKLIYFSPRSQLIRQWKSLLLLLGEVACSRNFPPLRMRDLASLHLTCAAYDMPTVHL